MQCLLLLQLEPMFFGTAKMCDVLGVFLTRGRETRYSSYLFIIMYHMYNNINKTIFVCALKLDFSISNTEYCCDFVCCVEKGVFRRRVASNPNKMEGVYIVHVVKPLLYLKRQDARHQDTFSLRSQTAIL